MKNNDAIFSLFGKAVWHPVSSLIKLAPPLLYEPPAPLNLIERNKPLGGFLKDLR